MWRRSAHNSVDAFAHFLLYGPKLLKTGAVEYQPIDTSSFLNLLNFILYVTIFYFSLLYFFLSISFVFFFLHYIRILQIKFLAPY